MSASLPHPTKPSALQSHSRRRLRIIIVCLLLALAAIYLVSRSPTNPNNSTNPSYSQDQDKQAPSKPVATSNQFYNAVCNGHSVVSKVGTLKDKELEETSGIIAAADSDDVYFVHNDSGDSARIFAVDSKGTLLNTYNFDNISAVDWEDIARGPGPVSGASYIYTADTGDNDLSRDQVMLYRVAEPKPNNSGDEVDISAVDTLNFQYPDDASHNVEAVFVDPVSAKIYFIDKSDKQVGQIFEAPAGLTNGSTTTLTNVGNLGYSLGDNAYEKITAADISADGATIAVRTYEHLYVYNRVAGSSIVDTLKAKACVAPDIDEVQGEAAAFTRTGDSILTVSEGAKQPIHSLTIK